eukprot:scaffold13037_cov57-Cyclotella_meneghiniana.AAC.3
MTMLKRMYHGLIPNPKKEAGWHHINTSLLITTSLPSFGHSASATLHKQSITVISWNFDSYVQVVPVDKR